VDCCTPGAQKSADPPCSAHLAGLCRPRDVHRPPRVILLILCSDHLAGRGDHLSLCCVHLSRHGGPRRHRVDRLPPCAANPVGRGGPCRHRAYRLSPSAAHPTGPDCHRVVHLDPGAVQLAPCVGHLASPIRQCDHEIRILDSNPFTIQFWWRPQYSFGTKGTSQGP
jgi:hypothetical protein